MRLKHLTLAKIVDTAYFCGIDGTPVSILIAAPSGAGKTWSTSAISETDFVQYLNKVYSPNEHRKIICHTASRVRLLINDDLGLMARWNQSEYFSTFCMICDGELNYTVYKQQQIARTVCSVILCCTTDYFYSNKDIMTAQGLFDRFVPIVVGLSQDTRRAYQKAIMDDPSDTRKPKQRHPEPLEIEHTPRVEAVRKDINPRLLRNLMLMSKYLTEEETDELIDVAHNPNGKYDI